MRSTAALGFRYRGSAEPSRFVAGIAKALRLADIAAGGESGKTGVNAATAKPAAAPRIEPVEWR